MNGVFAKHWFKFVTVAIMLVIIGAIGYNAIPKEPKVKFTVNKEAADFALDNVDGQKIGIQNTNGKVRLVYFYYSFCPDVCTPTTAFLSTVRDVLVEKGEFGKNAQFISITFDPTRDTTERLTKFADQFSADTKNWFFVRGEEKATFELAEKYMVGVMKDKDGNFAHTNSIALVDKKGKIRKFYDVSDLKLTKEQIANDVIALSKEK
ncbi:SCO family protein [Paenibacillus contaminans]|uniref:SCO family protein n=1 Tax=Paenibacillus contaminans TaxID=450362 RepID=A0A329MLS7_9BACL|nr:SCO family protein [Paenibacillus contaminans]RAV20518.1 SCO family protein [Paenibacillus contaminans]